jgi:membrane-anchored protein YejM (alkaline phosphatase superfamily)
VCTVSYCGILGTLSSKYWHQITPQPWNIADALKKFGYQNHYVLSGDHTSFYGLRKMFGGSIDLLRDGSDQAGGYNNDDRLVLKTLDETGWPTGAPGFMYIHLMSVHRLGLITDAHKRWDASRAPTEVPNASPFGAMDPRKHAAMRARYHNGILQADDMLRQIFERLARWQVLDDAVVVITADHGEFIGEMDKTSHGQVPYEPVVRIPLLIYDRQAVGTYQPRSLVSQIDIAPTLLAAIGAPAPRNWSGVPLQQATSRSALVLDSAEAGGLVAVLDGTRYKYLRLRDSGQELLFALGAGFAGESVNLAADAGHAAVLAQLRALHTELVGSAPKHDNPAGVAPR